MGNKNMIENHTVLTDFSSPGITGLTGEPYPGGICWAYCIITGCWIDISKPVVGIGCCNWGGTDGREGDGVPSCIRMLSFKSSNALLGGAGETLRGVDEAAGGGGRGGGGVAVFNGDAPDESGTVSSFFPSTLSLSPNKSTLPVDAPNKSVAAGSVDIVTSAAGGADPETKSPIKGLGAEDGTPGAAACNKKK